MMSKCDLNKSSCYSCVLPSVPLSVVKVEPNQMELTSELPEVGAGLTFSHQVFMSML